MSAATMDRETWLAERRKGICSTDASAIVGINPWRGPLDVCLDKWGQLPDRKQSPEMEWGLRLEPALAQAYADETGHELVKPAAIISHPDRPWQRSSTDYMRSDRSRIVELKTASWRNAHEWGDAGTDEVPEHYFLQVQHQMIVAEVKAADVAVLVGGSDFRIYTVEFNQDLADMLTAEEEDFWHRYVVARQAPPIDWSNPRTPELVNLMNQPKAGQVELDEAAAMLIDEYQRLSEHEKETKQRREEIKGRIAQQMGEAVEGVLPGGLIISRKIVERAAYACPASSYIDFRIKAPKPKKGRLAS